MDPPREVDVLRQSRAASESGDSQIVPLSDQEVLKIKLEELYALREKIPEWKQTVNTDL